jgi:hypothetical protein
LDATKKRPRSAYETAWATLYNIGGAGAASAAGLYAGALLGNPQLGAYGAYNFWESYKNDYLPSTSGQREAFRISDPIAKSFSRTMYSSHDPLGNPAAVVNPLSVSDVGNRVSDAALNILSGQQSSTNQITMVQRDFESYFNHVSRPYAI